MKVKKVAIVLFANLVLISACSPSGVTVSGRIVFGHAPLDDATIQFIPELPNNPSATAPVRSGQYTVPATAGLLAGKYRVEIRAQRLPNSTHRSTDANDAEEIIPERYNSKSELTVELKPGQNYFNLPLK